MEPRPWRQGRELSFEPHHRPRRHRQASATAKGAPSPPTSAKQWSRGRGDKGASYLLSPTTAHGDIAKPLQPPGERPCLPGRG